MSTTIGGRRPAHRGPALLASPVRRSIVDELAGLVGQERESGLSAAEIGERVDLHLTTVRFHVDQLVAAGVLSSEFVRSGGVGRPSKRYRIREDALGAVGEGDEGPFQVLAGLLTSAMSSEEFGQLTPEEAGVRWARRRADRLPPEVRQAPPAPAGGDDGRRTKVDEVIGLLAEWGYTPETETVDEGRAVDVTLRDCPFLGLAHAHPDVVCGVHRGLLRGALTAVGEPEARVSLQPFVGPATCLARLYLATDDDAPEDATGDARDGATTGDATPALAEPALAEPALAERPS